MPTRHSIPDEKVINIWKCPETNCNAKAEINPYWYQNNGIPMCTECDCYMVYSHTEIES